VGETVLVITKLYLGKFHLSRLTAPVCDAELARAYF
jgi:hypothetical protein